MTEKRAKTGGRQKGTPNKATKQLKDMILGALDDAGGQQYLLTQAHDNPTAFMQLVGKVLPNELKAQVEGVIEFIITTGVKQPKQEINDSAE